jgi:hypothetical protein
MRALIERINVFVFLERQMTIQCQFGGEAPGPVLGMPENLRHNPIPWQQRRPQRIRRHSAMTDAPDGFVRTRRALDLKPKGASQRFWIETIARVRIVRGVPPAQRLIGPGPLCLGIGELALEIS